MDDLCYQDSANLNNRGISLFFFFMNILFAFPRFTPNAPFGIPTDQLHISLNAKVEAWFSA